MMIRYLTLFLAGIFLSGCSFFSNSPLEKPHGITIDQSGIIQKSSENLFEFNSFVLLDDQGKILSSLSSQKFDLSKFEDKKVLISGEILEKEEENSQKNIIFLNIVKISEIPDYTSSLKKFPNLGVALPVSSDFIIEEKNNRVLIFKGEEKEKFLNIFAVTDPAAIRTFLKNGEKISVGTYETLRLKKNKKIEIFFPQSLIQVTFQGEEKDIYSFYALLERFEFSEIQESSDLSDTYERQNTTEKNISSENNQSDVKKLLSYIEKNKNEILETKNISPLIKKIGLYENNIVDIEYSLSERKMRSVLTSQKNKNNDQWNFSVLAKYEEGKIMSWDLIEGEIPVLQGASRIFLSSLEDKNAVILPENFALYLSTHFNFQIGYPRSLFFAAQGKSEKNLAQVSWTITPNNSAEPLFLIEILDGELAKKRELLTENAIEIPRTSKTHFKISTSDSEQWKTLNQMAETLVLAE